MNLPSFHTPAPMSGFVAAFAFLAASPPAAAQQTMNAVVITEGGSPEVLRIVEVPRPSPGAGEILVQVFAAAVNPIDTSIRARGGGGLTGAELPYIPGFDVSGIVAELGPDVEGFEVGEEVFAMLDLGRGGGYAEYVIARTDEAVRKPSTISHMEAAALPLVALTSMQAFSDEAGVVADDFVLIHAGAGGVGSIAVQLAKGRGATVAATASERNHAFLREIGADIVIDYRTQRFEDIVSDVDVVLDPIGGDTQRRSLGVLRDGGTLVSLVGLVPEARAPGRDIRTRSMLVHPDTAQLREIAELVDGGRLRPIVTHVFPLDEAPAAHEQSETDHTRGKIVLQVVR